MSLEGAHSDLGAEFGTRAGRRVVEHYGRPERAAKAVRNGVGLVEPGYGVLELTGEDRLEYVDNVVSNRVPAEDGAAAYALLLDPQGRIEEELLVVRLADRLLVTTSPGRADALATDWGEKVFIQDVEIEHATSAYVVFEVHGPLATEKIASVLAGARPPADRFAIERGTIGEVPVWVGRLDARCGEEAYAVICTDDEAASVHGDLLSSGVGAAPFGRHTADILTLEAGTPTYEGELVGQLPNVLGLRSAVDFEKGCFVGQEVVSRIENRGRPNERLVGLSIEPDGPRPEAGAAIVDGDRAVGELTQVVTSPVLDRPIAFALVEYDLDAAALAVRVAGSDVSATVTTVPFVDGSERSGRIPAYP